MKIVVAGIVLRGSTVLAARRPPGKALAGLLEFPGGKLEPGESPADALRREMHEELGVDVAEVTPFDIVHHEYPHASVLLLFYLATLADGSQPHPREGNDIQWLAIGDLDPSQFPAANASPIVRLKAGLHAQPIPAALR